MGANNYFLIGFDVHPTEEIDTWYYKPSQKSVAEEVTVRSIARKILLSFGKWT